MIPRHSCPLCLGDRVLYGFTVEHRSLYQCDDCSLLFRAELLDPLPRSLALTDLGFLEKVHMPRALAAEEKLRQLSGLGLLAAGTRVIVFRCEDGEFLDRLVAAGAEVYSVESAAGTTGRAHQLGASELEAAAMQFDICVMFDSLGLNANPARCLEVAHRLLKDDGVLVLSVPSIGSWPARLLQRAWVEFQEPYLYYFGGANIQTLLFKSGFDRVILHAHRRVVTLAFLIKYLEGFPSRRIRVLLALARWLTPPPLKRCPVSVRGSHMMVVARKAPKTTRRKLSVIVPVYNEKATVAELMNRLLGKDIPGLDREIIVVESASTDGTRAETDKYQGLPGVKLIYQDRPRGKGNAVREGFRHATGDFILIQDADLEYDVGDYDNLLAPLISGQQAFVIGSRHASDGSTWKMRQFNDMPLTAWLFNAGHVLFLMLFNLLYWQSLKDPFSMFKVFRRDCLYGLEFECDRFDFDFELVIKLIRKVYRPIEIPVNYQARSFSEGKKVRIFLDPATWIRALIKYRFVSLKVR